jgi:hypothetical protein
MRITRTLDFERRKQRFRNVMAGLCCTHGISAGHNQHTFTPSLLSQIASLTW